MATARSDFSSCDWSLWIIIPAADVVAPLLAVIRRCSNRARCHPAAVATIAGGRSALDRHPPPPAKMGCGNKLGSLLEVLNDLNLTINMAYISSDGEWFMDVFHVVDQDGNKLADVEIIDRIQQLYQVLAIYRTRIQEADRPYFFCI